MCSILNYSPSPGPGAYQMPKSPSSHDHKSSCFKSSTKRAIEKYFVPDPTIPGASDYNLQYYKGTSFHQLSGGAPNNILVLKRAIQKQQEKQYLDPSMYNSNKIIAA
jgi:hypothetical protein